MIIPRHQTRNIRQSDLHFGPFPIFHIRIEMIFAYLSFGLGGEFVLEMSEVTLYRIVP